MSSIITTINIIIFLLPRNIEIPYLILTSLFLPGEGPTFYNPIANNSRNPLSLKIHPSPAYIGKPEKPIPPAHCKVLGGPSVHVLFSVLQKAMKTI